MSNSIKLKDNYYLDSSGVVHNKKLLSTVLNELSEKNETYSTTETKTNKIFFGKPVYRKAVSGTTPTGYNNVTLQNNIDKLFSQNIMVKRSGIEQYHNADSGMVNDGGHNSPIFISSNNLLMYFQNSSYQGQPFYGYIEYTKTTD